MSRPTSRALLIAAFGVVYLVWGSTYLAIRVAIEGIPPFLMASTRFLIAGAILLVAARLAGAPWPDRRAWRAAALLGFLFLVGGNGGVVWAETRVASGLAAVLVAVMPLWTVIIERLRGGPTPSVQVMVGLVGGLVGVALLLLPGGGGEAVDLLGAAVLVLASVSWAYGSVISKSQPLPRSGAMSSGMQMLAGGAALGLLGLATGELPQFHVAALASRSGLALLYLILFGSLLAFSAFTWLLQVSTPGKVATYAYVNPVVAVILGWLVLSENFGPRHLIASAVIVASVAVITLKRRTGISGRWAGGAGETGGAGKAGETGRTGQADGFGPLHPEGATRPRDPGGPC